VSVLCEISVLLGHIPRRKHAISRSALAAGAPAYCKDEPKFLMSFMYCHQLLTVFHPVNVDLMQNSGEAV